jgi:hypothetical protein
MIGLDLRDDAADAVHQQRRADQGRATSWTLRAKNVFVKRRPSGAAGFRSAIYGQGMSVKAMRIVWKRDIHSKVA